MLQQEQTRETEMERKGKLLLFCVLHYTVQITSLSPEHLLHWINITYIFIHTHIFNILNSQASTAHLDRDYLENTKATEIFFFIPMPKTMASNIFHRSCLYQLFKNRLEGSDYQCFDNKVASPFNKMGGVRLNLQKIRKFPVFLWVITHH